jgi:hypothetical protein
MWIFTIETRRTKVMTNLQLCLGLIYVMNFLVLNKVLSNLVILMKHVRNACPGKAQKCSSLCKKPCLQRP